MAKRTQVVPSIDLHGLTREKAIRTVTDFLEKEKWRKQVCIITGTGSHSQQGPVLRMAIEKLLQKRQMDYTRNTPGSLMVDPASGIELFLQEPCVDSKIVIVTEAVESELGFLRHRPMNHRANRSQRSTTRKPESTSVSCDHPRVLVQEPSLQEVSKEQRMIDLAKKESYEQARVEASILRKESSAMEQALRLSQLEHEHHTNQYQHECEQVEKALQLSSKDGEYCTEAAEEHRQIRLAIQESLKTDGSLSSETEENLLQQAIKESLEELAFRSES